MEFDSVDVGFFLDRSYFPPLFMRRRREASKEKESKAKKEEEVYRDRPPTQAASSTSVGGQMRWQLERQHPLWWHGWNGKTKKTYSCSPPTHTHAECYTILPLHHIAIALGEVLVAEEKIRRPWLAWFIDLGSLCNFRCWGSCCFPSCFWSC